MQVDLARPDVSDLVLRVFGRPLHPELVESHKRTTIQGTAFSATLQLCPSGHVITFSFHGGTICEVATSVDQPLPQRHQVISRRIRGSRDESVEHDAGILYHVCFQLEQVEPQIFRCLNDEFLADVATSRLSHCFPGASRLQPAPLSLIQTVERPHSLLIHAFHTFPENLAVLRTQSLFEIPRS